MRYETSALLVIAVALLSCNTSDRPAPNAATPTATPATTPPTGTSVTVDSVPTAAGELKITPINHATLMLEWNGKVILVDPTPQVKTEKTPRADMILITDIHQDHMSAPSVTALKKDGTVIIAPPAVEQNLGLTNVTVIKNGQNKDMMGINIEALPMYNLTRGPQPGQLFHDKGRGNGYVLTFGDKRVYISGDTECTPEMKALKNIDVAFVCMNVPYTMPPSEAAACVKAFQPKIVYPYHYRGSNLDEFKTALADQKNVDVRIRNWYP
jgi:L-ascorbate metabolism protein UlaG (beta-lactamase superfamily)